MSHNSIHDSAALPPRAPAILVERPGDYRLVELPVPEPGPGDVLIHVVAAEVCGEDLALLAGHRPSIVARYPVIPGHASSGRIAATGRAVRDLRIGQPVVAEALRWCGRCCRCREGTTNLCLTGYRESGFTEPGAFSRYLTVPATLVHPLPGHVAIAPAALLEPAARVASALRFIDCRAGQRVLVVGAGTLGLLALQLLAARGIDELLVVDDRADRRQTARCLGATGTLTTNEFTDPDLAADVVLDVTDGPRSATSALRAARPGGTVVLVGTVHQSAPFEPDEIVARDLHVHFVLGARSDAWPEVIRCYADGHLDLAALVSHEFPLTALESALATVQARVAGTRHVLLLPS